MSEWDIPEGWEIIPGILHVSPLPESSGNSTVDFILGVDLFDEPRASARIRNIATGEESLWYSRMD